MRLLVVRHPIAADPARFGRPQRHDQKGDSARPLTPEGRSKMARAALGLKRIVPELELLATRPHKRAPHTPEISADAYGGLSVESVQDLAPGGGVERVVSWLVDRRARGVVAIVGHEP